MESSNCEGRTYSLVGKINGATEHSEFYQETGYLDERERNLFYRSFWINHQLSNFDRKCVLYVVVGHIKVMTKL